MHSRTTVMNNLQMHFRSLVATKKTLNYVSHMKNPQLMQELLQKLPDILKLRDKR